MIDMDKITKFVVFGTAKSHELLIKACTGGIDACAYIPPGGYMTYGGGVPYGIIGYKKEKK
jgi:hypothetical protein